MHFWGPTAPVTVLLAAILSQSLAVRGPAVPLRGDADRLSGRREKRECSSDELEHNFYFSDYKARFSAAFKPLLN